MLFLNLFTLFLSLFLPLSEGADDYQRASSPVSLYSGGRGKDSVGPAAGVCSALVRDGWRGLIRLAVPPSEHDMVSFLNFHLNFLVKLARCSKR